VPGESDHGRVSTILLVDDEPAITDNLAPLLRRAGFDVVVAHDGDQALTLLRAGAPDLVVLDVLLPGKDGRAVLRQVRQERREVPIILLTQVGESGERAMALEEGADDYLNKPFDPHELVARIRAVLRRTERADPDAAPRSAEIRVGDVWLNPAARLAARGEQELDLTTAEFDLLQHLLLRAGSPVPRDELAHISLGRAHGVGTERNVDTLVSKLRRKLGPDDLIKTVRNVGYLYVVREPIHSGTEAGA